MRHELRLSLNAIMEFSEVIKKEFLGPVRLPQYTDYAGDIYTSGGHLLQITNDILDFVKAEAGRLEVVSKWIHLSRLADAVIGLVRPRAVGDDVTLVHELTANLPQLHADKRKLKQNLLDLLSNGVKFTPATGTVDLKGFQRDYGGLTIRVRDTEIVTDLDQFDLVLSPFGQINSALARDHHGTGLGQPLVKALVEVHDGLLNSTARSDA